MRKPRKPVEEPQPGVPMWVVTYGDMMSLLLTFFIMLVSLSNVVATDKYRAVLDALERYIGYQTSYAAPPGKHFPLNALIEKMETLGSFTNDDDGFGGVKVPAVGGREVRVFRTPEGVPLPVGEPVPFAAGDGALSAAAQERLEAIAFELGGKPNKIEIRAHAAPPGGNDLETRRALLDLTYRRARAVMACLEGRGVARSRMRITSAADTEPLPDTGDEQARILDRVEVYLLDTLAEDYVGPTQVPD